jgi:hypothetical protein
MTAENNQKETNMTDIDWNEVGDGVYSADLDGNGNPDILAVDSSGDGTVDAYLSEQTGGDYVLRVDQDGDGTFEEETTLTRAEMEEVAPSALKLLDGTDDPTVAPDQPSSPDVDPADPSSPVDPAHPDVDQADPEVDPTDPGTDPDYPNVVVDGQIIGDPSGDSKYWFEQAANGFCLPASITQIVSEYTGVTYPDETAFVDWANSEHLFVVGPDGVPGVPFADGVKLLEKAGVPATLEVGDLNSLAEDLAEGRGVVLFIDSGEVWKGETTEDNAPDHAVVVTGIDSSRGTVILSDPGSPTGDQEEVPIETFMDAWADSQYSMIVCDQPAPALAGTPDGGDPAVAGALANPTGWVLLPVTLPASATNPGASV